MPETITFMVEASGDPDVGIDPYYNEITISKKYEDPEDPDDEITFNKHMMQAIKSWYIDYDGTVVVQEKR